MYRFNTFLEAELDDVDSSCAVIIDGNLVRKSCNDLENPLVICESSIENGWKPLELSVEELDSILSGYSHSMNSQSSCSAFCSSKTGTQVILIWMNTCICLDEGPEEEIVTTLEIQCDHMYPCPSSPLQSCGCLKSVEEPVVYPLMTQNIQVTYSSCADLKSKGIFVSGKFTLADGSEETCPGWGRFSIYYPILL